MELNKTGSGTDPWRAPHTTSLQPDSAPSQFSAHALIQSNRPELAYEEVVRDGVKSLAEVKVDNIHCSPLIYPAGHTITEGYQHHQGINSTAICQLLRKRCVFCCRDDSLVPEEHKPSDWQGGSEEQPRPLARSGVARQRGAAAAPRTVRRGEAARSSRGPSHGPAWRGRSGRTRAGGAPGSPCTLRVVPAAPAAPAPALPGHTALGLSNTQLSAPDLKR
ncbi:uncharacterized protein [Patagioenas fasciata]|uniref:uncharacterized protein n=1 Tax=Patagioenas fasciata TaxID=372321 RepID=UPI003A98D59F